MNTLLLVAVAIATPVVLVLPALAVERAAHSQTRAWRLVREAGFIFGVLMSASFVLFGIFGFVTAVGTSQVDWLDAAISLLILKEGTVAGAGLLLRKRGPISKRRATRFLISATGFSLITAWLAVASFVESWWYLPVAAVTGWFAVIYLHVARTANESA